MIYISLLCRRSFHLQCHSNTEVFISDTDILTKAIMSWISPMVTGWYDKKWYRLQREKQIIMANQTYRLWFPSFIKHFFNWLSEYWKPSHVDIIEWNSNSQFLNENWDLWEFSFVTKDLHLHVSISIWVWTNSHEWKKKSISFYLFANGQLESYRMKPENYIVKESPKASIIETTWRFRSKMHCQFRKRITSFSGLFSISLKCVLHFEFDRIFLQTWISCLIHKYVIPVISVVESLFFWSYSSTASHIFV